ncbi:MAG: hypothetical protein DI536_35110 [Archangium gephyra]|uniref:Uncharacterized protein n=1 Tax=Archangium gephyra TaxID=48 RepID=A0A2W5SM17_9BACT|nr:MAG: hypothetical protein DI536_35110 [Archangium gephyra]
MVDWPERGRALERRADVLVARVPLDLEANSAQLASARTSWNGLSEEVRSSGALTCSSRACLSISRRIPRNWPARGLRGMA